MDLPVDSPLVDPYSRSLLGDRITSGYFLDIEFIVDFRQEVFVQDSKLIDATVSLCMSINSKTTRLLHN